MDLSELLRNANLDDVDRAVEEERRRRLFRSSGSGDDLTIDEIKRYAVVIVLGMCVFTFVMYHVAHFMKCFHIGLGYWMC